MEVPMGLFGIGSHDLNSILAKLLLPAKTIPVIVKIMMKIVINEGAVDKIFNFIFLVKINSPCIKTLQNAIYPNAIEIDIC